MEKLSSYERETIIGFNEGEDMAIIFTYNRAWQKHLEKKLGLESTMDNGFGGKEYQIPKRRIRPPGAPVKLSAEARVKMVRRAEVLHQKRNLSAKNTTVVIKSGTKNQNRGELLTSN